MDVSLTSERHWFPTSNKVKYLGGNDRWVEVKAYIGLTLTSNVKKMDIFCYLAMLELNANVSAHSGNGNLLKLRYTVTVIPTIYPINSC